MIKKISILVVALIAAFGISSILHNQNPIVATLSDGMVPPEFQTGQYLIVVVSANIEGAPGYCNTFADYDPTIIADLVEIKKRSVQDGSEPTTPYKTMAIVVVTRESMEPVEKEYRLFINIGKVLESDPTSGCSPVFSES